MSSQVTQSLHEGIPVLALMGRIKGEGDEDLRKAVAEVCTGNTSPKIVIDVTKADYIDSHGMGVIIYHHKILQAAKRSLVLLNENPDPEAYMSRLIRITNLDKIITVVTSRDRLTAG
jgi:anti-anti-sigma factor